jgi:hypothetical protein
VFLSAVEQIFHPNLHANFHRRPKCPVNAGAQADHLADSYRMKEIHMIDRGRDHRLPAMPNRRNCARKVNEVHDLSAEETAHHVGVIGQCDFEVFGNRFPDGPCLQIAHELRMLRASVLTQITHGERGGLPVQWFGGLRHLRRKPQYANAKRMMVALLRPGDLDCVLVVRPDEEPRRIGFGCGSAWALAAAVAIVAATLEDAAIDGRIRRGGAYAIVKIAKGRSGGNGGCERGCG